MLIKFNNAHGFLNTLEKKGTLTKTLKKMFYKNRRKDSQEIKRIREKDDLMLNLFRLTEPNS